MCTARLKTNKYLFYGNLFFLPASLLSMFTRHHPGVHVDAADAAMGLCYGMMFGCYFLGLYKARRGER